MPRRSPYARDRARRLRAAMTDAERRLWARLRRRALGVRFRRQHPIGPYVADFACPAAGLVVEVDGSQHPDRRAAYDSRRDAWLRRRGYVVLRFRNDEVLRQADEVVERIWQTLERLRREGPPPRPSPAERGRGIAGEGAFAAGRPFRAGSRAGTG